MNPTIRSAGLLGIAIIVGCATSAEARKVKMTAPYGNGGYVATFQDAPFESFITFCIEDNEFFNNGGIYEVEIATSAKSGGSGGGVPDPNGGTYDPLNTETAWAYSEFRKSGGGALAGVGFDPTSASHRTALQKLVWFFEGENSGVNWATQATTSLIYKLGDLITSNTTTGSGNLYNVRVMRLWQGIDNDGNYYGNKQDQLIIIPMPAPAAMATAGLLGLGLVRRRR